MARTIESPGVEIREIDLSNITTLPIGTNILVQGFSPQGPTDELVNVTSISELENIYGTPTTPAERYFYETSKQVLNSPGRLVVNRLPYGAGTGYGTSTTRSALFYPVVPVLSGYSTPVSDNVLSQVTTQTTTSESVSSQITSPTGISIFNVGYLPVDTTVQVTSGSSVVSVASVVGTTITTTTPILSGKPVAISYAYKNQNTFTLTTTPVPSSTVEVLSGAVSVAVSAVVGSTVYTTTPIISTAGLTVTINYSYKDTSSVYNAANGISLVPGSTGARLVQGFVFGAPILIPNLSASQVDAIMNGEFFANSTAWHAASTSLLAAYRLSDNSTATETLYNLGKAAGMIVLNANSTNVESNFSGYYIGLNDNSNITDTTYEKFKFLYTRNGNGLYTKLQQLDKTVTLATALSGTITSNKGSVSEIVEISPGFSNTYSRNNGLDYQHALEFSLWKVYESMDETQGNNIVLRTYYNVAPFIGSFVQDFTDTLNNPYNGGTSMFVESVPEAVGGSAWMDVVVSPMIKNIMTTDMFARVYSGDLGNDPVFLANSDSDTRTAVLTQISSRLNNAATDGLFAIGPYAPTQDIEAKKIGNLVDKLTRGLALAENIDLLPLDIVVDGGLSTINAVTRNVPQVTETGVYNDAVFFSGIKSGTGHQDWLTVFNALNQFCGETRKDCMCIVDPLRHIFVQNADSKVSSNKGYSFSTDILTPLRLLTNSCNSSYAATYANWVKAYDTAQGAFFWAPFSGFQAGIMARVDALLQPWFAPAGLNNGIIRNIVDIAISPNQRERDLLYRNGLNPITSFPRDGFVVFGQKTMQAKPSAFDRINVRRLFLFLEKATRQIAKYFVFEPNTVFTRTRFVNVLTPIFELAKRNQGVYDYLIVCDERNNTPDVIDRNELIVDIYIKPVRTAEFILINFVATRTGANFEEIISGTGA